MQKKIIEVQAKVLGNHHEGQDLELSTALAAIVPNIEEDTIIFSDDEGKPVKQVIVSILQRQKDDDKRDDDISGDLDVDNGNDDFYKYLMHLSK